MNAVQEDSLEYPSQAVPSGTCGTRHKEPNIYSSTMVYEFRSTDPCDPRNCQIRLPRLAEENFRIKESSSRSHLNGIGLQESIESDIVLCPRAVQEESLGYPSQLVPSGTRYKEPNIYSNTMVYEFKSTDPCDPRNCQIRLPLLAEENLGIEESTSGSHLNQSGLQESRVVVIFVTSARNIPNTFGTPVVHVNAVGT
ncbi:unnamed protein product [Mytilus edulis]|uniref:Uncharacterized protein n=1 Tax=Mytilus edulis TaxID=6550 RepID=A0A8S3TJL8_MYTED|nr:unnamed protein product [Mytilus edulis]